MTKQYHSNEEPKAYLVDLSCNCNCYEGTEAECQAELNELINEYGHDPKRYTIRFTRFD